MNTFKNANSHLPETPRTLEGGALLSPKASSALLVLLAVLRGIVSVVTARESRHNVVTVAQNLRDFWRENPAGLRARSVATCEVKICSRLISIQILWELYDAVRKSLQNSEFPFRMAVAIETTMGASRDCAGLRSP